jgi:Holliday junction resolvase-like predicted endonuclease
MGRLGEKSVESWLTHLGWECQAVNWRIPGGEIDRLFVRRQKPRSRRIDICVSEIKTARVRTVEHFLELFEERRLRTLMRPHQIRNLWRTAEICESRIRGRESQSQICTYVRYFLVVSAGPRTLQGIVLYLNANSSSLPVRLCSVGQRELILAWAPDVPTDVF